MNKKAALLSKPSQWSEDQRGVEYARIQNGRIVEYPVPRKAIREEDLTLGRVRPVRHHGEHPNHCDKTQNCECKLEMLLGEPTWIYVVSQKPLLEFIEVNYIGFIKQYLHLGELNSKTLEKYHLDLIIEKLSDVGQKILNDFAKERGYDSIVNLVSYKGDPSERYGKEADIGIQVRSQVWQAIGNLTEQVEHGVNSFPVTAEQVVSIFPNLSWE